MKIASAVGAVVGAVVGANISVNIVIYGGTEDGYEVAPADLFEHNAAVAVLALAALIAGPVAGVVVARKLAQQTH